MGPLLSYIIMTVVDQLRCVSVYVYVSSFLQTRSLQMFINVDIYASNVSMFMYVCACEFVYVYIGGNYRALWRVCDLKYSFICRVV